MFRFFKVKYYLYVILLASTLFSICKTHNPEESNFNTITLLENNLENELIQISNGVNSLTATIENLSTFAKTHELNYLQVKNLWRFLYLQSISNHTSEKNNQSNIKKDTMNEEINYETKDSIGFYQLMIIMLVGYIIVGHLVKSTIMSLYFSEKYKFLFFLSLFFSYNLMVVAKTLQDQMEASFLPAIIYITVFLNLILCIHLILIKLRLQTALTLEQELYDIDNNKTGKIIMTIMGIILGYIFSFSCISPLVQLPFYFFLFYLVNLFRGIYIEKFSERLEPIILSTNSFFAFFLFGYLYFRGLDSFHEWIFLFRNVYGFEYLFSLIGQLKLINIIDFRFFGYLISVVILCSVFPLYLYIQNKNLWDSEFKYEKVLSNLKVEIAKENIEFDFSRIYFFIYGILLLFMVCFTLRERFVVGTLICLFCLVNFLNFSLRNQTFIGKSISFIGGFFLLTSIHLVGIIEDRFAPLILSDMREGYIVFFVDLAIKIVFHYFSIDIISATSYKPMNEIDENTAENDEFDMPEKKEESLTIFEMIKSLGAYILNYLIVVYFLAISEEEPSYILSFMGVIFAFLLFLKLLIYSYTTKEEISRILIAIFIYMAGIRFSMLTGNMDSPLYFGNILSNFSVCVSYFTIKTTKFQYVNFILLLGLFIQSFAVNSEFGLVIAILNFFVFITVILSRKHKEKRNGILIILGILTLMLWALSGFNLNAFFNIIETIMKLLPLTLSHSLFKIFDQGLLPEQVLMKYILKMMKEVLLGPDF